MAFNISYNIIAIDKFSRVGRKIAQSSKQLSNNFTNLGKSTKLAQKNMLGLGRVTDNVRQRVLQLGSALVAATGVNSIINFGQAMAKVKAISGATGEEFDSLRKQAKKLGATTIFSATQAAQGMEFLARAGFETKDIMSAIPGVLDLAASSNIGLAQAADIASNVISGFGLKASETSKIADILATAAASSNTDITQLGDAMKFVAPVAAAMGQSVESAAAAAGVLSNAGLQGSLAGTGLRKVFTSLVAPTSRGRKLFKAMGLDIRKLNPETNKLTDIVNRLAKANIGAGLATELFGDRGGPAILAMISQRKELEKLTNAFLNASGKAKEMADIMQKTLGGDIKALVSVFESLVLGLGDAGLEGAMRSIVQGITNFIRENYLLIKGLAKLGAIILGIKLAILSYGAAIKLWAVLARAAAAAQLFFNLAIFLNPIGLIIAGITAAVAAFFAFREELTALGNYLVNMVVPDWLTSLLNLGGTKIDAASTISGDAAIVNRNEFSGTLNIKGAPKGSSLQTTSTTPNMNVGMNMAGAY